MKTIKNNYEFKIVRYYLDKMIIEINPKGVTPPNADEYPMYVTRDSDECFKDVVADLTSF